MTTHDEHDDDLEPEVEEGAEIETEHYSDDEDVEEVAPSTDTDEDDSDDDASDTM
jgi:hypothetical protein